MFEGAPVLNGFSAASPQSTMSCVLCQFEAPAHVHRESWDPILCSCTLSSKGHHLIPS